MPATRKHLLGGVAVCAGITLSAFSVAWACTPGGGIDANPGSGAAGSSVLVSGSGYETTGEAVGAGAAAGPVEIRWNSMSGTVLATASGPSFSTSVTIPASAEPRTYYLVAVQRLSAGGTRNASAPFTVTAVTSPAASEPQAEPRPQAEAQPQPVAQQDPAPAPAGNEAVAAPPASANARATATAPAARATAPTARTTARSGGGGGPGDGSGNGGGGSGTNGGDNGGGGGGSVSPPAEPGAELAQLPSGRTLSSDVWSGFSEGATSRGPSLVEPTSSTNGSGDAGLGLGLVALGTVGLLGGTVVGIRSRRRLVPVEASADTE